MLKRKYIISRLSKQIKNSMMKRSIVKLIEVVLVTSLFLALLLHSVTSLSILNELNENNALGVSPNTSTTAMPKILFTDPDDVHVKFKVKDFRNNTEEEITLVVNKKTMTRDHNVTVDQVKQGWIEISPEGVEELIINGKRFPLGLSSNTIIVLTSSNGSLVNINIDHFLEQTMKDIEGDPSLIPEKALDISWKSPTTCTFNSISINITSTSIKLLLDNVTVNEHKLDEENRKGKISHIKNEGLVLSVLNPSTCETTLDLVTYTSDISGYRDLLWGLKSILPGKLVLISSLRDGAAFLGREVRRLLYQMGSLWSPFYFYRDSWFSLFVKGGKVLHDIMIPNLGQLNSSGSPISFHSDALGLVNVNSFECLSWPTSERWEARKIFCQIYDGFSNLCDCENPFDFRENTLNNTDQILNTSIPLVFITGNRTRHLFHLFETLAPQENATRDLILLVTDGHHEQTTRLAFVLGLKLIIHRPEGEKSVLISRNLRFALYNGLKEYPKAKSFILLEDDLLLSPDFYSFMKQMEPIFDLDKSVLCVSAFNHLSYPHTSMDPTLTYRVQSYPAYGWMMSRNTIEEILPKWMPANFSHDWDYFIGSKLVRKDRECIVPDINRSYHWSTKGFHMTASYASEILFLSRTMNKDPNTKLLPIDRLIKENYEKEFTALLKIAIPVTFMQKADLDKVVSPGNIYVIYVKKKKEMDSSSFRLFGEELEMWSMDARDHHNSAWRMFYKNATIFVVGYPLSPYRVFVPKDHKILIGDNSTDSEINNGEFILRSQHPFLTHANFSFLPKW